jgi:hypothetical protein
MRVAYAVSGPALDTRSGPGELACVFPAVMVSPGRRRALPGVRRLPAD